MILNGRDPLNGISSPLGYQLDRMPCSLAPENKILTNISSIYLWSSFDIHNLRLTFT